MIGEKCLVNCSIDRIKCEGLYDTGAMVSLISKSWLRKHLPQRVIRPVKELLDDHEIVLKTATESDTPFIGFVELEFRLSSWVQDQ